MPPPHSSNLQPASRQLAVTPLSSTGPSRPFPASIPTWSTWLTVRWWWPIYRRGRLLHCRAAAVGRREPDRSPSRPTISWFTATCAKCRRSRRGATTPPGPSLRLFATTRPSTGRADVLFGGSRIFSRRWLNAASFSFVIFTVLPFTRRFAYWCVCH